MILHDYNARLCAEMDDRKKLTTMLKDFQTEQRELLAQAEQRLQVNMRASVVVFLLLLTIHTSNKIGMLANIVCVLGIYIC